MSSRSDVPLTFSGGGLEKKVGVSCRSDVPLCRQEFFYSKLLAAGSQN
jgi:hypothetical protein